MRLNFARIVIAATIVASTVAGASAQSATDFYKGKNVDLYIGYSVGGAYDLYEIGRAHV